MKYNEVNFSEKVKKLYNDEIKIISRYKGLNQPILVEDKYGVMSISSAQFLLYARPGIKSALNKTEYFMNVLKEKQPKIAQLVEPVSEYKKAKEKMLFRTRYGVISINPDSLLSGHEPTVRVAVDRKNYMKNQLLVLYGNKYDFEITSTDRHSGKCTLICPKHGRVEIDNDYIFSGVGCPKCNHERNESNILYIVKLKNESESFYKLGITYEKKNGELQRFKQYRLMGYEIETILIKKFDSALQCAETELKLKHIIKDNLYQPKNWPAEISTETFSQDLLTIIIDNIDCYMI